MNSVSETYNLCLTPQVSVLLGGITRKIYEWLKDHEGLHHINDVSKGVGRNSKKGRRTVGRILRRLRQKGYISSPKAQTITGSLKTVKGFYEWDMSPEVSAISNATLEACPFCSEIDSSMLSIECLKVHRVDLLCSVPGLWSRLVDKGNLTFCEASNLSRYKGSSMVLGHNVELFKNSAWYRGHCEAVSFSGLNLMSADFVRSVEWFCGVRPSNVFLKSFEAVVDFPASEQTDLHLGYLKIYLKEMLGKRFIRTEMLLRDLDLKFPFDLDEKEVMLKMLKALEPFERTRDFLKGKLGFVKVQCLTARYNYDASMHSEAL